MSEVQDEMFSRKMMGDGMLVPQLRYYGVEFDYTVCNNGAIIRDAEGMVRYRSTIPAEALTNVSG